MSILPTQACAPVRRYERDGTTWIDWCLLGDERFVDPFYTATLHLLLRHPFRMTFRPRTRLDDYVASLDGTRLRTPAGIVHHMSRCGSTLIARTLAQLPRLHVASEPPVLDDALRRNFDDYALRAIVHATACGTSGERPYVIKADCWHVLSFDRLRRALPGVPWVFLYRDPRDVIASLLREPAYWAIPGTLDPAQFGVSMEEVWQLRPGEYAARVLAAILRAAAAAIERAGGLLIHYEELPTAIWTRIGPHFGLNLTSVEIEQIQRASTVHSKSPATEFTPDSQSKRASLSTDVLAVCDEWLSSPYRALELLRAQLNSAS